MIDAQIIAAAIATALYIYLLICDWLSIAPV
jgi:hypothetical protein